MAIARRMVTALALVLALTAGAVAQPAPDLIFEMRGSDLGAGARLGGVSEEQLRTIVGLVGLDYPGEPIGVVLAAEDSDLARGTPPWIAGFAHAPTSTVVLFPSRSHQYPHDSLEAVLYHEVAHILIGRAAGGGSVPRWFNEGLATVAERPWHFEDRRQLAWALATSGRIRMDEVDRLFERGSDAPAAYAFSGAFVRDLIDAHGADAPARILSLVAGGAHFEAAFARATGTPLPDAERRFHARLTPWERWIPLLTSPFALWTAMTLLALYAIWVRMRRRAERRRQWDEEENEGWEDVTPGDAREHDATVPDRYLQAWPPGADSPDDEPPPRGGPH